MIVIEALLNINKYYIFISVKHNASFGKKIFMFLIIINHNHNKKIENEYFLKKNCNFSFTNWYFFCRL